MSYTANGSADSADAFRPPEPPTPGAPDRPQTDGGFNRDGSTDSTMATDGSYGTGPDVPRQILRLKGSRRSTSGPSEADRLGMTIQAELERSAEYIASEAFPGGPAGSVKLAGPAALSYVRRNWLNPETGEAFRTMLLDRIAPKLPPGPDGKAAGRLKEGLDAFWRLYHRAVLDPSVPDTIWTTHGSVSLQPEEANPERVEPLDEPAQAEAQAEPTAPTPPSTALPNDVLPQAPAEAADVLSQMDGAPTNGYRPLGAFRRA